MRVQRRYVWTMAAAAGGVLLLVLALYALADPQGILGTPTIPGFNAKKPYLEHNRELARWSAARRLCATAGLFGNSRVEVGFDPAYPAFDTLHLVAFNHAIPGRGIDLVRNQLSWLRSVGCKPALSIVGVEFFDFLVPPDKAIGAPPAPVAAPSINRSVAVETMVSLSGFADALRTFAIQPDRYAAQTTPRGWNPMTSYIPEVARTGAYPIFRQRAEESVRRWQRQPRSVTGRDGAPAVDFGLLDEAVQLAAAEGGRVRLVIYPYHAQYRLLMNMLGFDPAFVEWKRRLVDATEKARASGLDVELWDFSLVSPQTSEPIPAPGDRRPTFGYWESGHFKRELGDLMLDRMLLGKETFGARLERADIDRVLAEDRRAVAALWQDAALVEDVRRIVAQTSSAPPRSPSLASP